MVEIVYECWSEDGQHKMYFSTQESESPGVFRSDIDGDNLTGYPCFVSVDCLVEQIEQTKRDDDEFPREVRLERLRKGIKECAHLPIVVLDLPTRDIYPPNINEGRHRVLTAIRLGIKYIPALISDDYDAHLVKEFIKRATVTSPDSIRINSR